MKNDKWIPIVITMNGNNSKPHGIVAYIHITNRTIRHGHTTKYENLHDFIIANQNSGRRIIVKDENLFTHLAVQLNIQIHQLIVEKILHINHPERFLRCFKHSIKQAQELSGISVTEKTYLEQYFYTTQTILKEQHPMLELLILTE